MARIFASVSIGLDHGSEGTNHRTGDAHVRLAGHQVGAHGRHRAAAGGLETDALRIVRRQGGAALPGDGPLFRKETHRARRGVRPCAQRARSDVHGAGRRDGQRRSHPAAAEQPAQVLPGGARQDDARRHRQEPPRPAGDAGKGDCRRAVRRHDQSRSGHFGALLHGFGHHRAQGPHSARGHDRARRSCRSSAIFSAASPRPRGCCSSTTT